MKANLHLGALFIIAAFGSFGCTQEMEPMCQPGEEICNAEGSASFACKNGTWEIKQACTGLSESCSVVQGEAGCFCEDGVFDCSEDGRAVQQCAQGQWVGAETCAEADVCNYDGEAEAVTCMPSDLACDPTRERERCRVVATVGDPSAKYTADAYECAPNGRWTLKTTCSESDICIMKMASPEATKEDPLLKEVAVCEPFPCQEGMEYCPAGSANGNPHVCENGRLVKRETCPQDTACIIDPDGHAVCVDWWTCTPGIQWCDTSGNAYVCSEAEEAELLEDCDDSQACVYFEGKASCAKACTPGAQQCSSDKVAQTCGSDRTWQNTMVCQDGEECVVYGGEARCRAASQL